MNIVWGVGGTVRDLTLLLLARAPLLPRDLSAWGLGGSCANSSPASWFLWENVLMDGPWVNVWDVGNLKI